MLSVRSPHLFPTMTCVSPWRLHTSNRPSPTNTPERDAMIPNTCLGRVTAEQTLSPQRHLVDDDLYPAVLSAGHRNLWSNHAARRDGHLALRRKKNIGTTHGPQEEANKLRVGKAPSCCLQDIKQRAKIDTCTTCCTCKDRETSSSGWHRSIVQYARKRVYTRPIRHEPVEHTTSETHAHKMQPGLLPLLWYLQQQQQQHSTVTIDTGIMFTSCVWPCALCRRNRCRRRHSTRK